MSSPGNFAFLAEHSPLLADLGATAERLFPFDPASCVLKLRLLAEAITQDIAARLGISLIQPTQAELLRAVDARLGLDAQVRQLFHLLRRTGNLAAHEADHGIGYRQALEALKVAREIAVWFTAIRRATNTVRDELLQSFQLPEGALAREDEPTLPLRVIREAVVNAVMHRSYRIHGATQIIRYANRLEIRNPGHSIKAEEQLGEPGSETRNPRIAAVLHEVNIAETKGSGIRAMRELMLAHDLLPPTFESTRQPDQFVATFLFHHFLGPDDLAWLRRLTREAISDEEARALVFVRERGAIDNAAYRSINHTDTLNASVHLRRLRDLALLAMKGSGSRTYYVPGAAFAAAPTPGAGDAPEDGGMVTTPAPDSHQPGPDSHHPLVTIPKDIQARLPAPGAKPRREVLRALILELCALRALSARELAAALNRTEHKPLVRDYLSPMVKEGVLAYTIPEMENHPDQRYSVPGDKPNP